MTAWYIDTHCHLGAYSDPASIANAARRTVIIAMTESPGDYLRVRRLLGHLRTVRVALGLHPLRPPRPDDFAGFTAVLPEVEYVGEVGIDRSKHSEVPEAVQRAVFERILALPTMVNKVVSVHSRRAEKDVVSCLERAQALAIMHWYTGPAGVADVALQAGLYFSINAAMTRSVSGRRLIGQLPPERVLTESDGPFVRLAGVPATPASVATVVEALATAWSVTPDEAREQIQANMKQLRMTATSRGGGPT